jgi:nucleoside-diphosphate-sugar epimerase
MDSQIIPETSTSVFITGATSAVGLALMRLLSAHGHHVAGAIASSADAAMIRSAGGTPAYPDLYRAGELRSAIQGTGSKIVVNLAPQVPNQAPQANAEWDERLNEAVEALINAAKDAGADYLIHTSYAFADAEADGETEAAFPLLKAARLAERTVLSSDLPSCVLRLGYVYGAESSALKSLMGSLREGKGFEPGSTHTANWIYAGDAAAAIYRAMLVRPTQVTLDIVDDQPVSPAAFLQEFANAQGLTAPVQPPRYMFRNPYTPLHVAMLKLDSPPVTNEAAKAALDWSPQYPTVQQGIDDLLVTWRASEVVTV